MTGLAMACDVNSADNQILLSVVRAMAEDLLKCEHPQSGCPVHGQGVMRRDKNGVRYCGAAGCGYVTRPGSEPTLSAIIARYLEQIDAT